ncbi:PREDICTED: uncharacterized protein LOC107356487 [Acropora digitifera]|uniref:uncharacterized protein LOC107356487 n=1 Tax=Acropora digitifera TaxID=70779 RepID=UPI00077A3B20|nr:PREDICTED: uncharacterized protein LOC107356487 [Acropora digitifera]
MSWELHGDQSNVPVNGPMLQEEALIISQRLVGNSVGLTASNGWLSKWRERYNISEMKVAVEEARKGAFETISISVKLLFNNFGKISFGKHCLQRAEQLNSTGKKRRCNEIDDEETAWLPYLRKLRNWGKSISALPENIDIQDVKRFLIGYGFKDEEVKKYKTLRSWEHKQGVHFLSSETFVRRMRVFSLLSFKFSHYYLHLRSKYNHYSSFYYRTQIVPCDTRLCAIQAAVNPSFSTDQDETKLVYIILQRSSAKPVYTHCTCTVGLRKDCSHIGAVLFLLCDIIAEGHEELPVDPTCIDMKCKWTDPKGANCEPKMVEDLHIYKAKFGTKPSSKIVKPSASFANKVFKCDISQDKRLEKKLELKNDILIANQRDSIPPIFHLIGVKK